jgi:hypothetical protein
MARHAYDRRGVSESIEACMADSRRFLEAIRASTADDLHIDQRSHETRCMGHRPQVRESQPDLVIVRGWARRGATRRSHRPTGR